MAITKRVMDDKIEVIGDLKAIQIRTASIIEEDGVELTRTFSRRVLQSVISTQSADDNSWTHTDTDISGESAEIQGIATAVWNTTVKNAQKAANEVSLPG